MKTQGISLWLAVCLAWIGLGIPPVPAAPAPRTVWTLDVQGYSRLDLRNPTNAVIVWDTLHSLFALQGLVNRVKPRLYVFFCREFNVDTDRFWFDWYRGEDGWLKPSQIEELPSAEAAIRLFRDACQGLVVYDPRVPATANLASTAAGCEDLLPVRYDPKSGSVFDLLSRTLGIPVRLWLLQTNGASLFTGKGSIPGLNRPSTGSAKNDAYLWALDRWVRPGRTGARIAAYYIDSFWLEHPARGAPDLHTLSNHDFFVARRAFFFDLSPWADEAPNDDAAQPLGTDRKTFLEVMAALHARDPDSVMQVGGFTPWPFKYTTHSQPPGKHEGVPTEWEFARLISQYNGYMEADAAGLSAIANASFSQHYPLAHAYPQPKRPGPAEWRACGLLDERGKPANKLFLGHYVGDYDAPSWVYKAVPAFFRDPALGKVPLGWALNPNLADRAPQALVYARRHATTNDWFVSGDSGAGYLNARALTVRPESRLPSGLDSWTRHCRDYFRRWDLGITGFLLDGAAGRSTDGEFAAYRAFSPDGIGTHFERAPAIRAGVPTCPERDLPDAVQKASELILAAAQANAGKPSFFWARSILKPPQWYADLSASLMRGDPGQSIVVVDPYTFFGLIRLQLGGAEAAPEGPAR